MNKQTDKQKRQKTDRWTNRQMENRHMNKQTDKQKRQMDKQTDEQTDI